jgi:hypothetical protein
MAFTINGAQSAPCYQPFHLPPPLRVFRSTWFLLALAFLTELPWPSAIQELPPVTFSVLSSTQINALLIVLSSIPPRTYTVAINNAAVAVIHCR